MCHRVEIMYFLIFLINFFLISLKILILIFIIFFFVASDERGWGYADIWEMGASMALHASLLPSLGFLGD